MCSLVMSPFSRDYKIMKTEIDLKYQQSLTDLHVYRINTAPGF